MPGVPEFSHAVPGNVIHDPIKLQSKNNLRRFVVLALTLACIKESTRGFFAPKMHHANQNRQSMYLKLCLVIT